MLALHQSDNQHMLLVELSPFAKPCGGAVGGGGGGGRDGWVEPFLAPVDHTGWIGRKCQKPRRCGTTTQDHNRRPSSTRQAVIVSLMWAQETSRKMS